MCVLLGVLLTGNWDKDLILFISNVYDDILIVACFRVVEYLLVDTRCAYNGIYIRTRTIANVRGETSCYPGIGSNDPGLGTPSHNVLRWCWFCENCIRVLR